MTDTLSTDKWFEDRGIHANERGIHANERELEFARFECTGPHDCEYTFPMVVGPTKKAAQYKWLRLILSDVLREDKYLASLPLKQAYDLHLLHESLGV